MRPNDGQFWSITFQFPSCVSLGDLLDLSKSSVYSSINGLLSKFNEINANQALTIVSAQ